MLASDGTWYFNLWFTFYVITFVACPVLAESFDTHLESVGTFTGNATVVVQNRDDTKGIEVRVAFDLGKSAGDELHRKIVEFPSDYVSVWVLCENSESLELSRRVPSTGQHAVGIGNGLNGSAQMVFGFKPTKSAPKAVVLGFKGKFHVFALDEPKQEKKR